MHRDDDRAEAATELMNEAEMLDRTSGTLQGKRCREANAEVTSRLAPCLTIRVSSSDIAE